MAVVVLLAARRRVEELADAGALVRRADLQQAPDLARQHVVVALLAAQETVEPRLGQAEAVERRGVVVAAAGLPGLDQDGMRLVVGDGAVEIAERRRAEAQFGERKSTVADTIPMPGLQRHASLLSIHLRMISSVRGTLSQAGRCGSGPNRWTRIFAVASMPENRVVRGERDSKVQACFRRRQAGHRHGPFRRLAGLAAVRCRARPGWPDRRRVEGSRRTAEGRLRRRHVRQRERPALRIRGRHGLDRDHGLCDRPGARQDQRAVRRQRAVGPDVVDRAGRGDGRVLRARDLHRHLCLRHGTVDAGCRQGGALSRPAAPLRHGAALQRLGRVRLFARPARRCPTARARRCFRAFRTRSWCPGRSPARRPR